MRLVVTKDDYFAAALDALATSGHGALRIGTLCTAIGVTTGSFYHYFGSWDGFVLELLTHWEQEKTHRLVVAVSGEPDPVARLRTIKRLAVALPHEAETAIRAWAHSNPIVAQVQQRVDDERLDSIRAVILGVIGNRRRAEQLAVMGITLLVGVQQWRSPVDRKELGRMLDEYEQLILSHATAVAS
ncbi:MAG: TetR/AcrR family transcriptional regulator [Actinomycetota bacterium]|nr:TetR/AcrR family transcriptional regulator [Actinomycetota bacterium]